MTNQYILTKQLIVTLRRLDTKNYPFDYTSKNDDNFTIA